MHKLTMPQAGQTMEEGTILSWRKAEGDRVEKGEVLLEIETDKATVEVEAPASGILGKILCPEGFTVPVLAPIALISSPGEDPGAAFVEATAELRTMLASNPAALEALGMKEMPAASPAAASPATDAPRRRSESPGGGTDFHDSARRASPAARKKAREGGIEIAGLPPGSGPRGRVLSTDLDRAEPASSEEIRRPLTGMRRAIARNLQLAKQTIPHFYVRMTIDATPLREFYREQKAAYPCTINDVIAWACARVIREFPAFRSRVEGEEIIEAPEVSIGIAVGMDDGLRVPVLAGADRMSLRDLAAEAGRIIDAAQRGKLGTAGRSVFTISNLGMFGVEEFAAIINPPEAAILAVGAIREEVLVQDGCLRAGRVMTMTLSADHRVVDGLMAAKFLRRLKEILEAPASSAAS